MTDHDQREEGGCKVGVLAGAGESGESHHTLFIVVLAYIPIIRVTQAGTTPAWTIHLYILVVASLVNTLCVLFLDCYFYSYLSIFLFFTLPSFLGIVQEVAPPPPPFFSLLLPRFYVQIYAGGQAGGKGRGET